MSINIIREGVNVWHRVYAIDYGFPATPKGTIYLGYFYSLKIFKYIPQVQISQNNNQALYHGGIKNLRMYSPVIDYQKINTQKSKYNIIVTSHNFYVRKGKAGVYKKRKLMIIFISNSFNVFFFFLGLLLNNFLYKKYVYDLIIL